MKSTWFSPMKSVCNTGLVLSAIAVVALLCPIALSGQVAYTPNVNNVGLPANGVFSGGSIDSVQLQNGNLHVDIPLLHLPGIGMDTDIHFVYDNQLFNMTTVNYGNTQLTMTWEQISMGRNGFAQVSDPLQGVLKAGTHQESWNCSVAHEYRSGGPYTHIDYMAFTDSNGTGHSFPIYGYESYYYDPENNPNCKPADDYPANSYSGDATGYNLNISTADGHVVSLTDKHGTQYTLGSGVTSGDVGATVVSLQPPNPGLVFTNTPTSIGPTELNYQQVIKVEDSDGNTISRGTQCQSGTYCFIDTVGRTIVEAGGPGGLNIPYMAGEANVNEPGTISYLDQNGTTQTITINYSPYALDLPSLPCNPVVCGVLIETPVSAVVVNLPTSIILQNGDTYTIQYKTDGDAGCNPGTTLGCTLGEISSITLPTGGIISYTWSGLVGHPGKIYGREVLSRTVTANGQSSTWRFTGGTVTDPNMNDTVYTFDWTGGAASANSDCRGPVGSAVVTQEVSYNGPQSANNPIDTRNITYAFYGSSMGYGTYLPTSNVLTWISSGATTETDTTYDNPVPLSAGCPSEGSNVTSRGNVVSKKVYDYGSGAHGALLSNTQYSYWHNQYSAYAAANIADRVSQVSVYDAGNSLVAQTTTNYDGFSQSAQSGLAAPGWTTTHDSGYSSAYTLRGLPTSVTKCSGPSSSPCSASITTYADYNTLGQPTVSTDGRGYSTTNTYSQQSNTFVATTTLPLTGNGITHATTKYTDVNTGLLMEQTDFNNNSTSYTYERLMRPHSIQRPDGGSTRYSYPDPNQVVSVVKEDSSGRKQATTTDLDGLGRTVSVSSTSDAACGLLIVDTKYDLLGRKIAISNPHCLSAQATDGWSRYTYDAIGRLTSKQNPDGTAQHWSFNGNVVNSYDEKQNLWTRTYNAESWLTQVLEPSGGASSTLETDYGYDTLGNLQQVDQWGGAYGSSNDHVRQFSYDAISRLIQGYNPESGWTCYGTTGGAAPDGSNCSSGYDGNGNLLYKTDARGITISYSYDAMNRLLGKTYSDGTPPVALTYDTPGANAIGQLTEAQAGSGSMMAQSLMTSYDPMGRLVSEQQCTPANCPGNTSEAQTRYSLGYQYDFTGFVTQSTNSAGMYSSAAPGYQSLTLTNTPDVAERLTQITSNWSDAYHPSVLFRASSGSGNPGYGPMGLLNATLGVNSLTGTTTGTLVRNYDNRGRTVFEADSGQGPIATTDSTGSITINGAEQQLIETNMGGIASFSIGGQEYTHNGACLDPESNQYTSWCGGQYQQVPDIGWVAVTITTPSGSYTASGGWSVSTDTPTTVASSLASSFNSLGSPAGSLFTATANGNVVTVQALATGPSSDYSYTISNPACYPVGAIGCSDFWAGGSNPKGAFINGTTAGTYYDQGTVTATISGTPVSVNYGACSTASSIASSLASAINSTAGGFVSAIASGQTVSLTSAQGGPSTDWSLSTSVTWDQSDLCRISTCPPGYCQPASCAPSYTVSVDGGASSSGSMTGGSDSSNGVVYSFMIPDQGGFDPVGNLLSVQDSVMGNWSYSYDNLNRLIGGSAASGAYSASPPSSWSYDPFGNRTSGVTPVSSAYASYALPNNQITGGLVQYDAAGNVTFDANSGNSYLYDGEGRICAVSSSPLPSMTTVTGYFYDAAGTRVAKGSLASFSCNFATNGFTPTTSYVLGLKGEQITELTVNGSPGAYTSSWKHANVFDGLGLQATYSLTGAAAAPSSTYFALNDWLGTKRAEVGTIVGSNGAPQPCTATFASLPYGDGMAPSGNCPDATEHHFTGKERDTESGNDYFGARYYNSAMGRFMSPDWSAKIEPIPYSKLGDPQTLNLYAYVGNNPMTRFDADGHELVKLGQHTDDQINARTKAINGQLKDKTLSADAKAALKAEKTTLGIEKQGNSVIGGMLSKLDQTGQRNGLKLSDFTITTSPSSDFAGRVTPGQMNQIMASNAFVNSGIHTIFVRSDLENGFYNRSIGNSDWGYFGASALAHEQVHYNGQPHEQPAFARQRDVLNGFRTYYGDANLFRQQYNYIEKEANIP